MAIGSIMAFDCPVESAGLIDMHMDSISRCREAMLSGVHGESENMSGAGKRDVKSQAAKALSIARQR